MTASNGHTYGVALLSADGATPIAAVAEEQAWDTGVKALGAIAVPEAGNYVVKLTNATQWSEAVLNSITFAEAAPALENGFYLVGSINDWTPAAEYHLVGNPDNPAEFMVSATLAEGDEIKVCNLVDNTPTAWYPAGDNYVVDAAHAGEKTIYFQPDYKADWADFGGFFYIAPNEEPQPAEDGIWKVTEETAVAAGTVYVDNSLANLQAAYGTTLKTNARTIAGEEFTHAIQVRVDAWPTAENLNGTEKSGSTSLILTANEDIEITLYYNRQVVGEGGTENDNKDIWVYDQADLSVLTGVFTIDQILEGNNYLNATKKLSLLKDHVYTICAKGTTIQLHGIAYQVPGEPEPQPVEHTYTVAGDNTDLFGTAWTPSVEANDMALAEGLYTWEKTELTLAAGNIEFKVCEDHA
jgi:hypothetical protein